MIVRWQPAPARQLNRKLGLDLPVDGPKTLNGWSSNTSRTSLRPVEVKIAGVPMEVVQAEDRRIKNVRIFRPQKSPIKRVAGFTSLDLRHDRHVFWITLTDVPACQPPPPP